MKSLLIPVVLILSLIFLIAGCSDSDQPIDLIPIDNNDDTTSGNGNDTLPAGPALILTHQEFLGCVQAYKSSDFPSWYDTLSYEVLDDTLVVHVTIYKTCPACMSDSLVISDPMVDIYVQDTCGLVAYCLCYHKFDYFFTGFEEGLTFNLYYKPYDEVKFEFWTSLNYP